MEFIVDSLEQTQQLAKKLANISRPGTVILLDGPLAAGKTTFTKYFVQALGGKKNVTSPTFNILKIYNDTSIPIYHFDMYRLENIGGEGQGFEDYISTDGIALIEWASFTRELIPKDAIQIKIEKDPIHETKRIFNISSQSKNTSDDLEKLH